MLLDDLKPHLQDLRKRLVISIAVLVVAFGLCFHFWQIIFEWIRASYHGKLIQISPIEGIMVAIKVSFFCRFGGVHARDLLASMAVYRPRTL
ncbi:Twin-arginine translocation protein TatC [Helicobacter bizzozeronii CCUG 35545]|nr:Twin-arginine translocation protein TatC [Helicobacter bizzozeronii CCUG 35545]